MRLLLEEACGRISLIEAERAKRNGKKDAPEFETWAVRYYGKNPDVIVETLRHPVSVVAESLRMEQDQALEAVRVFARAHSASRCEKLLDAHEAGEVAELAEIWKVQGGAQMRDSILTMLGV